MLEKAFRCKIMRKLHAYKGLRSTDPNHEMLQSLARFILRSVGGVKVRDGVFAKGRQRRPDETGGLRWAAKVRARTQYREATRVSAPLQR